MSRRLSKESNLTTTKKLRMAGGWVLTCVLPPVVQEQKNG